MFEYLISNLQTYMTIHEERTRSQRIHVKFITFQIMYG